MLIQKEIKASKKARNTMDTKRYIVVKNHVRELVPKNKQSDVEIKSTASTDENITKSVINDGMDKVSSSTESFHQLGASEICKTDLEELKSVYNNCKDILLRIESKYGHLLQLNSNKRKRNIDENECNCTFNKRILFGDEGQKVIEQTCDMHICPRKLMRLNNISQYNKPIVSIENDSTSDNLPENLQELSDILKDSKISDSFRYKVLSKIKFIKQINQNVIRFDKASLIERLKSNPDDVVCFKGSNLASIVGYPVNNTDILKKSI